MLYRQFMLLVSLAILSNLAIAQQFELSSPTIKPDSTLTQEQVFNGFGCAGQNLSPVLQWTAGPAETKSYALTVYDPDAPTGSGWWHWVVYNIPAGTTDLQAGAGDVSGQKLPAGALQGRTDFGTQAFGGACPPEGDKPHHYIFTVYALKIEKIEVPVDSTAAMIGFMINANAVGKASFTATFGR